MFFWYWLTWVILDKEPLNGLLLWRLLYFVKYLMRITMELQLQLAIFLFICGT